jgi:RNA recognition motif-containing protein
MAVRLFVGNLAYDVTEAELRTHFAAVGPLSSLYLPMDRDTGKPRGFAFIEFHQRSDAEEAIRRLNNQEFKGRPLAVSEARARDDRSSSVTPRTSAPRPPSTTTTPRPSVPRPPLKTETGFEGGRDFGPDAVPRRRRRLPKGAEKAERRPKRPMHKRAAGPIRFDVDEDDFDEDDMRGEHFASQQEDFVDQDTE